MWAANESEWMPKNVSMRCIGRFVSKLLRKSYAVHEWDTTREKPVSHDKILYCMYFSAWTLYQVQSTHYNQYINARFHLFVRSFGFIIPLVCIFKHTNWIRVKSISLSTEGTHIYAHVITSCVPFSSVKKTPMFAWRMVYGTGKVRISFCAK